MRLIFAVGLVAVALSSCDGRQQGIGNQGDWFDRYDYDLHGESKYVRANYKSAWRDWPVTFIFKGPGVSFDRVTKILKSAGANESPPGHMHMYQRDAPKSPAPDASGGWKDTLDGVQCPGPINRYNYLHMRFYGDPNDGSTATSLGKVVVGTTHFDYKEHCPDATFGWSEDAANLWQARIRCLGYSVHEDFSTYNAHKSGWKFQGSSAYWQNDGVATVVEVPTGTPTKVC